MTTESKNPTGIDIPISWTAFVQDNNCIGYREFKTAGKYYGKLVLISKPTESELKAELKDKKISLPK